MWESVGKCEGRGMVGCGGRIIGHVGMPWGVKGCRDRRLLGWVHEVVNRTVHLPSSPHSPLSDSPLLPSPLLSSRPPLSSPASLPLTSCTVMYV